MSLPKTMGKCGPPQNQTNYMSLKRYWWELFKNVLFIEFELLCQKLWAFFVKFWHFLQYSLTKYGHLTWPKKKISNIFYFVLILHLILKKVTKFLLGSSLLQRLSAKNLMGLENTPPSAIRVKTFLTWNYRHITSLSKSRAPGKVQVFLSPWFCMGKIIQNLVVLQVQYKTYDGKILSLISSPSLIQVWVEANYVKTQEPENTWKTLLVWGFQAFPKKILSGILIYRLIS